MLGKTHEKLYEVLHQKFASSDQDLALKLQSLQGIEAYDLHIDEALACPLPLTVSFIIVVNLMMLFAIVFLI